MKIACIGTGSMGKAIISAVAKKFNPSEITVSNRTPEKAKKFAEEIKCNFAENNVNAIKDAKYIFIAVKPIFLSDVFSQIKDKISHDAVVISMAAGVTIQKLETFANARFVRIMPNVPCQIAQGMTALCANQNILPQEIEEIKQILETTGKVEQVPENLMDCVTAVSGSGPAFVFMFIEAFADAAVKFGLPRNQAYIYAAQTVKGSADLVLQTQKHPGVLKDSVTSPGGTTIEGVASLEETGFRASVIQAVTKAYQKSVSMGK